MSIQLGLKLTAAGLAELAAAEVEERKVNITQMVLGDANGAWYEVTGEETGLLNELLRIPLLQITREAAYPNRIVCDAPIPAGEGGFTIREFGLLSDSDELLAIGMHQLVQLPQPGSSTTIDLVIRGILELSNASIVNLTVDPYIVTATRYYVDDQIATIVARSRRLAHFFGRR